MDSGSSNDDDEPKVCRVFASAAPSSSSKTIFDTIAFSVPKKEPSPQPETSIPSLLSPDSLNPAPTAAMSKTNSMVSIFADDLQSGDHAGTTQEKPPSNESEEIKADELSTTIPLGGDDAGEPWEPGTNSNELGQTPGLDQGSSSANTVLEKTELVGSCTNTKDEEEEPLPTATSLFADRPEVPFPVNIGVPAPIFSPPVPQNETQQVPFASVDPPLFSPPPPAQHTFSPLAYTSADMSYDTWIPNKETREVLSSFEALEESNGIRVPDKAHMTMPGVIYEEDMIDKVGLNMSKLFGDLEASRRKILTADNVTQDDNGVRELIKLGCYRSAINLTKRLLILYGQGPGKVGHYSKHTPHSLQLWFTRISLLVRIREFAIADSELEAFRNFESPDLFYEYYPAECFGCERKGSLVPFHFRLLAAEIPQYMRRFSETMDKLCHILYTVQKILGEAEVIEDPEAQARAVSIWKKREIRVLFSLANSSLFAKDYYNGFIFLQKLCIKDPDHLTQFKSAIGRLFLQHGDLETAQLHFQEAADLRSAELEADQVDTLVDSALVSMAQNLFPEALVVLKQAALLQPDNFMVTNNISVCLLYMGKVKESLSLMEATVRQNIPQALQENVILNLSSMYELENTDGVKKLSLLKLISEYKGDGINLASLKMPNLV